MVSGLGYDWTRDFSDTFENYLLVLNRIPVPQHTASFQQQYLPLLLPRVIQYHVWNGGDQALCMELGTSPEWYQGWAMIGTIKGFL